ncbi:dihydrofolate reductase [Bacillus phage Thurquoise]|uniref:dihydrofolate reductase n=1 Tax=Bacillus phage Deep Blue TaxID=1792245 RepID=A0A140HLG8_9CAUD|nr:dihydrofolate reductase [Bacillus phage Deep Blue]AMO25830.1 dihydrofolate reductase [Bacillus phage Deep Blue]UXQ88896.1 dihydrofolate reductase [Bacillus phage Thurquoise]
MEISLIAAIGKNNEIGLDNELLWRCKEDFDWFKKQTYNKPVVMGRKTYESIGKPLPHRINIVLSRDESYDPHESVLVLPSVAAVFSELKKYREVMIIGGANVYKQFMPFANRLYLTELDKEFEADSFFPSFVKGDYRECFKSDGTENVGFKYEFKVYRKKLSKEGQ